VGGVEGAINVKINGNVLVLLGGWEKIVSTKI
jgi:hypothetical protein